MHKENPWWLQVDVIEVRGNVIGEIEIRTRTSKLRKREFKLDGKPTSEGQRHWVHPIKNGSMLKHGIAVIELRTVSIL